MRTCSLCDIAEGRLRAARVYEDALVVVLLDLSKRTNGRLLVVPKTHAGTLTALSAPLREHLYKISRRASQSLDLAGVAPSEGPPEIVNDPAHVHLRVA